MSRQNLPELTTTGDGSAFFPSLQKEMNRLFDQFRNGFPTPDTHWPAAFTGASFPAIDVIEKDDAIEISAELPGVSEDEVDVSISGDVLTLKGKKEAKHEQKEDDLHVVERRYGSFRRQVPLGFTPGDDAVDAQFSEGVLKLTIAKPAETQAATKKINIKKG